MLHLPQRCSHHLLMGTFMTVLSLCIATGKSSVQAESLSSTNNQNQISCAPPPRLLVTDYGVVGDGKTDDTVAMRRLLRTPSCSNNNTKDCPCHKHIVVPEGAIVMTFPLNMTSHTTLQVDGTLQAMANEAHWTIIPPNPIYGDSQDRGVYQYQGFLYAEHATNIRVTGSGIIDGSGPYWWDLFHNAPQKLKAGRPNLFQTNNCTDIEIDSVTMKDAAFWTVHPMLSRNIYIHHMKIRAKMYAPNVDGIDPDSCQNVLIEYNDVSCGDDHIAIKSGGCGPNRPNNCMDPDWQYRVIHDHYVTRNVTVRHNIFRTGMGIAVGSDTSGGMKDVFIYNNTVGVCEAGHDDEHRSCGWGPALHLKTTLLRSNTIDNIIFRDNIVYNTSMFIFVETDYQVREQDIPPHYNMTVVKNIVFENNQALGEAVGANFHCSKLDPCHEIRVVNNTIAKAAKNGRNPWGCQYIDSYHVGGNTPEGLEDCMAKSMSPTTAVLEE